MNDYRRAVQDAINEGIHAIYIDGNDTAPTTTSVSRESLESIDDILAYMNETLDSALKKLEIQKKK